MLPRRRCVYQHADDKGIIGVELNKQLVQVAGKSLQVRSHLVAAQRDPLQTVVPLFQIWLSRHAALARH